MDIDTPHEASKRSSDHPLSTGRTVTMVTGPSSSSSSVAQRTGTPMAMSSPRHLLNTGNSQGQCSVQSFEMVSVYRTKGEKYANSGGSSGSREAFSFGKAALLRHPPHVQPMPQQGNSTPDLFQKRPPGLLPHPESSTSTAEEVTEGTTTTTEEEQLTTLDFSKAASHAEIEATILGLTDSQKQSIQRLLCTPKFVQLGASVFDSLKHCPDLGFLILSQEEDVAATGDSHSGSSGYPASDMWPDLEALMHRLQKLVCLDVSNCNMTDSHLKAISLCCKGLRALDLSYSPSISTAALADLLKSCTQLEELDVSSCPQATSDELMTTLADSCPLLTSLYIEHDDAWSTAVGATSRAPLTQIGLIVLASGCRKLQVLSLAGQRVVDNSPALDDDVSLDDDLDEGAAIEGGQDDIVGPALGCGPMGLAAIAMNCPDLISLDLSACEWLSDEGLKALSQGLKDLVSLQVSGCTQLTSATLDNMSTLFPKLAAAEGSPCAGSNPEQGEDTQPKDQSEVKPLPSSGTKDPSAQEGQSWNSLMHFLSTKTADVMLNSCKRPTRRPR